MIDDPVHCILHSEMQDLDEMNIEIMRNTLYKAYLDDFAEFCQSLGGATADVMGDLLAFEVSGSG
jgi:V-type H+-transporting ATPase subunit d